MSIHPRPQPYRLDPPVTDQNLPQIVTNADEMFQMLFEDVAALDTAVDVAAAAKVCRPTTASTTPPGFGFGVEDGVDGQSIVGPAGPSGPAGPVGFGWAGDDGVDGMFGPPGVAGAAGSGSSTTEFTTTTTGNIDDLDFSNASLIRFNNATLSTLRGLVAGTAGQRVTIVSLGAGQVDLAHQNAGSSAANRLLNTATSANTPLAAGIGRAIYQYDATTARWRLVFHDQGAPIAYTATWKNAVTDPALGNGTQDTTYVLHGRFVDVYVALVIGSTTTLGTGSVWTWTLPIAKSGTTPFGTGFVTSGGGATNNTMLPGITTFRTASGEFFAITCSANTNVSDVAPAGITTGDVLRGQVFNYPIA